MDAPHMWEEALPVASPDLDYDSLIELSLAYGGVALANSSMQRPDEFRRALVGLGSCIRAMAPEGTRWLEFVLHLKSDRVRPDLRLALMNLVEYDMAFNMDPNSFAWRNRADVLVRIDAILASLYTDRCLVEDDGDGDPDVEPR